MTKRSGFVRTLVKAQHDAERRQATQLRQQAQIQTQAAKAAEKARKDYERAQQADQKERARLYAESRIAQVDLQNEQLNQDMNRLSGILTEALSIDSFINLQTLKQVPEFPVFNPGQLGVMEQPPVSQSYMPPDLTRIQKLIPGTKEKHAQDVAKAYELYRTHVTAHAVRETTRLQRLGEARASFERQVAETQQQIAIQHAEIDNFQRDLSVGSPSAVVDYFTMVLASSSYPDGFPQHAKIAYVPESKQLVIEYDLPSFEVIPEVGLYKYVKTKDEVTETARPHAQRKALYSSIVAQITLRSLYELFKADRMGYVDIVVFNGYVDSIDKGTGRPLRACLITVRTNRDTFMRLDLSKVDPLACLNALNASVSKSPTELAPVRPVLGV